MPLADRIRPATLNDVVGQSHLIGKNRPLTKIIESGRIPNMIFYGPSGVGKTHLLYAITNRITKNYPDYRVIYVSGEEFTNQLIDAIHRNITPEFREKYRKADVLLIDDIHFIAGKDSTQEEFFHTFNELYKNNKQIILTSDRPPKDIKTLENRLRTRFDSGLTADIQLPDLELRAAIIKMKAEAVGVDIPDDVVNYIAENINDSVRNLEGAVNKIGALNKLSGQNISLDLAVRCISDKMVGSEPVNVTIDKILHTVSSHYNITVEDMKSRKRISSIASARHVAVYIIKKMDSEYAYLTDGKNKLIDSPKKKKIKHIQVIKKKDSNLESKHNNHISIQNEDIKKAIKLYISSNKEE